MRTSLFLAAAVMVLSLSLIVANGACKTPPEDDPMYLVQVHQRQSMTTDDAKRLSPSLIATRDADGILKGVDDSGAPLIQIPLQHAETIKTSPAVRSVSKDVPPAWRSISKLKVSLTKGEMLGPDELKELGLKEIETYRPGSFIVVAPLNDTIDATLIKSLASHHKISYVTPVVTIMAVPNSR